METLKVVNICLSLIIYSGYSTKIHNEAENARVTTLSPFWIPNERFNPVTPEHIMIT